MKEIFNSVKRAQPMPFRARIGLGKVHVHVRKIVVQHYGGACTNPFHAIELRGHVLRTLRG